jgi:RNA recognition motif-containing protein
MDSGLKLFVNHLPKDWTESMIFDFFSAHGKVLQVSLFKSLNQSNRFSGLGCANVKFAIRSEGEEVMAKLNHTQVK